MKIIIDTNLLVAYMFNKKSSSAKIIELAEKGIVDIMWHKKLFNEADLITGKIERNVKKVEIDLEKIFKKKNEIKELPDVKVIDKDPDDNKFLACALAANTDIIVSNDEHLLELVTFQGIPIYTSSRALEYIKSNIE